MLFFSKYQGPCTFASAGSFSPPFSFSLACQRKRKCAAGGGKEKEIVLAACRWLGQKTNCGARMSAECLSICSAATFAAAGAECFDHRQGSGSGNRSRSSRDAASLTKAKYVVRGAGCRFAPIAFSFSSVPSTARLLFLRKRKKKKMWG